MFEEPNNELTPDKIVSRFCRYFPGWQGTGGSAALYIKKSYRRKEREGRGALNENFPDKKTERTTILKFWSCGHRTLYS